jgi:hypothetical protein
LVKNINNLYSGEKSTLLLQSNQFYKNQYGNIEELKQKFYGAKAKKNDVLNYNKKYLTLQSMLDVGI